MEKTCSFTRLVRQGVRRSVAHNLAVRCPLFSHLRGIGKGKSAAYRFDDVCLILTGEHLSDIGINLRVICHTLYSLKTKIDEKGGWWTVRDETLWLYPSKGFTERVTAKGRIVRKPADSLFCDWNPPNRMPISKPCAIQIDLKEVINRAVTTMME